MLFSTQLLVSTLLGSAFALPGAIQPQTTTTKCTSTLVPTPKTTLKSSTKCSSSLKSTPETTSKSTSEYTSSLKSTSKYTSLFTSTTTSEPTLAPSKSLTCGDGNAALTVLKGLGPPASSFCSSYLHLPSATSTTITLPVATTTLSPATIVVTITPSTEIVTVTPTTETITITPVTELVTITPSTNTITVTPTTETATVVASTVTVTATATPVCNNKRSDIFSNSYIIEQKNSTIYAKREPNAALKQRTIDLEPLAQFTAEQLSAGCSCLSLLPQTVTTTVTPTAQTIAPTAIETITATATTTAIATATETDTVTATETATATATETETAIATVTLITVATATVTFTPPCPCRPPGTLGCTVQNFISYCCQDSEGSVGCNFNNPGSPGNGYCFIP